MTMFNTFKNEKQSTKAERYASYRYRDLIDEGGLGEWLLENGFAGDKEVADVLALFLINYHYFGACARGLDISGGNVKAIGSALRDKVIARMADEEFDDAP